MIAAMVGVLLGGPAQAAEVETGLIIESQVAVDPAWDRPGEDRLEWRQWVDASARGDTEHGRWQLAVWGSHEVLVGADTEAAWELQAGESGWEGTVGPVGLRVGHLVERWGNLDLLSTLDTLNGRDLRAGPLTPLRRTRLPAPLVRLQAGGSTARAELTVLPFGARDRVALWGTDLAVARQGMPAQLAQEASGWPGGDPFSEELAQELAGALAGQLRALDAQTRRGAEAALAAAGGPRPLDQTVDVGARVEATLGRLDAAVVGAWLRNRQPVPTADDALTALLRARRLPGIDDQDALTEASSEGFATRWPRTALAGLELGTVLGTVGLRTETALHSHRSLSRTWLRGTTRPAFSQGLAVDRAWGTWLTVALEGRYTRIFDPPADLMMVAAPHGWELGGAARLTAARDRLGIELGGLANLVFAEAFLRPGISWRISDAWELGGGAVVFVSEAPAATRWDQALRWDRGPLSYASDADAAFVSLRWIR